MATIRESAFLGLSAHDFFRRNAAESLLRVSTGQLPVDLDVARVAGLEALLLASVLVVTNDFIAILITFDVDVFTAFQFLLVLTGKNLLHRNRAESVLHFDEAAKRFHVIARQLLVHRNQTIAADLPAFLPTRMIFRARAGARLVTLNNLVRTSFVTRQRTNVTAFHRHSAHIRTCCSLWIRTATQFHAMLTEGQIL